MLTNTNKAMLWSFPPAWVCLISNSTDGSSWDWCLPSMVWRPFTPLSPESAAPASASGANIQPVCGMNAWHSSGYKYWGIFPLSGQESQWCPHRALAAWSGFCSALISIPFALALKELKHPKQIISVPRDCHSLLELCCQALQRHQHLAARVKAPTCLPSLCWSLWEPEPTGVGCP